MHVSKQMRVRKKQEKERRNFKTLGIGKLRKERREAKMENTAKSLPYSENGKLQSAATRHNFRFPPPSPSSSSSTREPHEWFLEARLPHLPESTGTKKKKK